MIYKKNQFFPLTIKEAKKIDPHLVAPNPRVCCLVTKNNKIISKGVYQKFGGEHAEKIALKNLPKNFDLSGAEIFITLEPCDFFPGKKTPSCTEFLIKKLKNFKNIKIFVGVLDPKFGGKNLEKIRESGIEVIYEKNTECEKLNPFLDKFVKSDLPFLSLKIAQSLDGKITDYLKKWLTNKFSRKKVHEMRAQFSSILTTTKTIEIDNPSLDCRLDKKNISNPDLLIFGDRKNIPKNSKIFDIPLRDIYFFENKNILENLKNIKKLGVDSIMTECGQKMNSLLLAKKVVDEINFFIAPKIIGANQKNVFNLDFDLEKNFILKEEENLGEDVFLKYSKK